jgi:hypothetical protein
MFIYTMTGGHFECRVEIAMELVSVRVEGVSRFEHEVLTSGYNGDSIWVRI